MYIYCSLVLIALWGYPHHDAMLMFYPAGVQCPFSFLYLTAVFSASLLCLRLRVVSADNYTASDFGMKADNQQRHSICDGLWGNPDRVCLSCGFRVYHLRGSLIR